MKICNIPDCPHRSWDTKHTVYDTCFMHTAPSNSVMLIVWQAICANPRSSLDELHDATGYSRSVCNRARAALARRGAIAHDPFASRTMRVTAVNYHGQPYRLLWFDPS